MPKGKSHDLSWSVKPNVILCVFLPPHTNQGQDRTGRGRACKRMQLAEKMEAVKGGGEDRGGVARRNGQMSVYYEKERGEEFT